MESILVKLMPMKIILPLLALILAGVFLPIIGLSFGVWFICVGLYRIGSAVVFFCVLSLAVEMFICHKLS